MAKNRKKNKKRKGRRRTIIPKETNLQKHWQSFLYIVGGLFALGTLFDALSNAMFFITLDIAFWSTILIPIFYLLANWYVKSYGVKWLTNGRVTKRKVIPKRVQLFFVGALALIWIAAFLNNVVYLEEKEITCDRDTELGCSLDIKKDSLVEAIYIHTKSGDFKKRWSYIPIKAGGLKSNYFVSNGIQNDKVAFPDFPQPNGKGIDSPGIKFDVQDEDKIKSSVLYKLPNRVMSKSPYTLWLNNDLIFFKGIVNDLKTDKMVGWFDENEFEIVKPCGFSWNKDETGVEIMDIYGHICFSIDKGQVNNNSIGTGKGLNFQGYFKHENYYYIYGDGFVKKTKYLAEAIHYIKKIEPRFDHFGKNSLGKRL